METSSGKITIISTTGTSILTNCATFVNSLNNADPNNTDKFPILQEYIENTKYDQKYSHLRIGIATMKYIEDNKNKLENQKVEIIRELTNYVKIVGGDKASAEINTIDKIKKQINEDTDQEIIIEFIVSDTFVNNLCVEILKKYYSDKVNKTISNSIEGLGYESSSFIRSGLKSLIIQIIGSIENHQKKQEKIIIAATGGFKAEFAYITIIATLYNVNLYYIHEAFRNLVKLPSLPIQSNKDFYLKYYNFFKWLEKKEYEEGLSVLDDNFPDILENKELEHFFEREDNNYRLSPIIEILRKQYGNLNLLILVDGPNVSNLDLKELKRYAKNLDDECRMIYVSHTLENDKNTSNRERDAEELGYVILKKPKRDRDIDEIILSEIDSELKSVKEHSAKLIIIASGDKDYFRKIKISRKYDDIDFLIATGNLNVLAGIYKLMRVKLLYFPNKFRSMKGIYLYLKSWDLNPINNITEINIPFKNKYEKKRIQKCIDFLEEQGEIEQDQMNNIIIEPEDNKFQIKYNLDIDGINNIEDLKFLFNYSKKNINYLVSYMNDHEKIRIIEIIEEISNSLQDYYLEYEDQPKENLLKLIYYNGIVKSFKNSTGYGFIIPKDGFRDIYVRMEHILTKNENQFNTLNKGDKVRFRTEETNQGIQARDVMIIKKASN